MSGLIFLHALTLMSMIPDDDVFTVAPDSPDYNLMFEMTPFE